MCSGPRNAQSVPPLAADGISMDGKTSPVEASESAALLLELSAADDIAAFKQAVEESDLPLDASGLWYSRTIGPASSPERWMRYEQRTPIMIAALYGSTSVLSYILSRKSVDVNLPCGSDGATALHCAAAGGSVSSIQAVKLLIEASADVDSVDANGNRPGDVIAKQFSAIRARDLEVLLKAPCPRASSPSRTNGEKKEYPPDLTLPDIKNGIYGTDEFRMFTFKVKPCSRAYSHDWTECPFVHPGENARRRDPRKFSYSCVPCPEFRKGSCLKGDACEYAHGVFESWLHPAQYRTRLCKDEIGCNRRVCFFAHKPEELRMVNPTTASVSGLVPPSPRSPQMGVASLEMAAALMMLQSTPASPRSPSTSSAMSSPWMSPRGTLAQPPSLQLPSSRLKSALSARDLEFDFDLMGLEAYQQKLLDGVSHIASPRSNRIINSTPNYNDPFGSLDPAMLSGPYASSLPSSPASNSSSAFGLDHSMAKAIINSRQAAFAKRSQSYIDHGQVHRHSSLAPPPSSTAESLGLFDWNSPDGKLDWGIQVDELNKLRNSPALNYRNTASSNLCGTLSSPAIPEVEPSWVPSVGPAPISRPAVEQKQQQKQKQQYQRNGAGELLNWEQIYAEQEQMINLE
ncbi:Zinc finger CCCH domain-containing protein 33 [Apostasia shenzhenica]|uniref:Zinc finger CCCH domain-containing protein 33 n=1 Tax=Apostasia shenzhenica TaxID=1088818 RepID=A0A2I0B4I7_9ASPA|nr:Zinc finger CCCH domain-containing protein 33 [Apostasia shenzhenica]